MTRKRVSMKVVGAETERKPEAKNKTELMYQALSVLIGNSLAATIAFSSRVITGSQEMQSITEVGIIAWELEPADRCEIEGRKYSGRNSRDSQDSNLILQENRRQGIGDSNCNDFWLLLSTSPRRRFRGGPQLSQEREEIHRTLVDFKTNKAAKIQIFTHR